MTDLHTIRVYNYCGDQDDLDDTVIIGPYPTITERDADIRRLTALPEVRGSMEFYPSIQSPRGADHSCTAADIATAADLTGILVALRIILP